MKHPYYLLLLYGLAVPAFAVDFEVSGQAQIVAGIDDNIYFTNDNNKNGSYGSGRLRLRTDAIFTPTLRFNTEVQTGGTLGKEWSDRAGITTGIYNKQHENFMLRKAHLAWDIPSSNSQLKFGVERISLPSATFGNPVLDSSLGGISYNRTFADNDHMQVFFGKSIYNNDYIKDLYTGLIMFELKWTDLILKPYYSYSYYKYQDKANLGFTEKLKEGDINIAGIAGTYDLTNQLQLKFDLLYGDQNNKKEVHYYETKGHHVAFILDYTSSHSTYGIFAWHSSGNDNALDEKDDFGFIPMISTGGFSPTRLGFKNDDGFGRQGILSDTGAGTVGIGFHIKNIHTLNNLTHVFRTAYIQGTTKGHGDGAPISANIPSLIRPNGEAGFMTNKDHAIEFNFDSSYKINENLTAKLDLGYIISGFNNSTYDNNPFNVQIGLNYLF